MKKSSKEKKRFLCGKRILPPAISKEFSVAQLIEETMLAYNGGRLRAACLLFKEYLAKDNVTIGFSLAGALTPAGLGVSAIIPLMKHGYIDWMVATGANMYHDMHFAFNLPLYQGTHCINDVKLREHQIFRIYDIFGDAQVLYETDRRLREILVRPEFQKEMGTQEFYYLLGKALDEHEKKHKLGEVSILACAYRLGIPIFTSSPGDSTIGMDIAGLELIENKNFKLKINPSIDVNETTAIVLNAKFSGGKSAVVLIGGGSPKNFVLQTEPHIQEILMIKEMGHDYDINITDARPDTGGLSGATPQEAVSWGKINPQQIEKNVVVYGDATVYLPLLTAYILSVLPKRKHKRLYDRRKELYQRLREEYFKHNKEIPKLQNLLNNIKL
ncbi:MAG: deoxyhypusine synthase [candidate division WOR-3 bacterium]|nr:deoxyhypusine synthase [candidate division WOR-3 bacterium]MCX7757261.1 deoxyhypusine synthase [candidate division WOR-3 bacterium]MDW7987707.1 deoxyhypusine synthase [candidate division WOR-3 bacterium]